MDSSHGQSLKCTIEALDLLNCTTASPYDQDKCLRFLQSLRQCVLDKKVKKFSLSDQTEAKVDSLNRKEKEKGT